VSAGVLVCWCVCVCVCVCFFLSLSLFLSRRLICSTSFSCSCSSCSFVRLVFLFLFFFAFLSDSCRWVNVVSRGTAPSPRWGHQAVLVKGEMMILGGRDTTQVFDFERAYLFDFGRFAKLLRCHSFSLSFALSLSLSLSLTYIVSVTHRSPSTSRSLHVCMCVCVYVCDVYLCVLLFNNCVCVCVFFQLPTSGRQWTPPHRSSTNGMVIRPLSSRMLCLSHMEGMVCVEPLSFVGHLFAVRV
jgi:hypothetical protein